MTSTLTWNRYLLTRRDVVQKLKSIKLFNNLFKSLQANIIKVFCFLKVSKMKFNSKAVMMKKDIRRKHSSKKNLTF